jgi:hypothetical protein
LRTDQPGPQVREVAALLADLTGECAAHAGLDELQSGEEFVAVGRDELGAGRGGWRAQVGDEVRDGEVGLVADRRHRGNRTGRDRARHGLEVEGPEILEGASAAGQQDHVGVELAHPGKRVEHLALGGLALDRHRQQHHVERRKPAGDDVQHVAQGGAAGGRNDRKPAWQIGQGTLALGIEQAFPGEPVLQRFERGTQGAGPGGFQVLGDELEIAARLVEAEPPAHQHAVAIPRLGTQRAVAAGEHRAADLRGGVLQREVPVT